VARKRLRRPKTNAYRKRENPELTKVVRKLKGLVQQIVPGTAQTVNAWGIPTFELDQPFCFYMVGRNHVTLGFHKGTSLADPGKVLEGTGKNIRHVKLKTLEDLDSKSLRKLIQQASKRKGPSPLKGMGGRGER
jgi:hypothetical protein